MKGYSLKGPGGVRGHHSHLADAESGVQGGDLTSPKVTCSVLGVATRTPHQTRPSAPSIAPSASLVEGHTSGEAQPWARFAITSTEAASLS